MSSRLAANDFPDQVNPKESPASEITEARPLPGVVSKYFLSVTQVMFEQLCCNVVTQVRL